jgi:hypothetical protein
MKRRKKARQDFFLSGFNEIYIPVPAIRSLQAKLWQALA